MAYSSHSSDSGQTKPAAASVKVAKQGQHGFSGPFTAVPAQSRRRLRGTRKVASLGTIGEAAIDVALTAGSLYFVVYAGLVYTHRGEPSDSDYAKSLLKAAQYNPTIFPIAFSAIVARFMIVLAHAKLEAGARVLTLEHLLHSRSVFSTFTAALSLRSFHVITPLLLLLWALSPLGGQASLRIVSTQPAYTIVPHNFTYLAYASAFSNEGEGSPSANLLTPINAAFTSALVTSKSSKEAHQDPYGNIKIPIYGSLPPSTGVDATEWREIADDGSKVTWSSLTGIPIAGLPTTGISNFTMNTGYMYSTCNVDGEEADLNLLSLSNSTNYAPSGGYSGANFAIAASFLTYLGAPPANFTFRALASEDFTANKTLTVANCTMSMEYVELQVRCDGATCKSLRARPAPTPATHIQSFYAEAAKKINLTDYTPLNGLAQPGVSVTSFWKNFVNSTNPSIACDTSTCTTSGIEGYLVDPNSPFSFTTTPLIWQQGNELISQRFTQLINTYWINSVAPRSTTGNFSGPTEASTNAYNTDSFVGTIQTAQEVLKVNMVWLVILLVAAAAMFLCGIYSSLMGMRRRGPDILDSFTALLRDNPYVQDEHYSSMEDASAQARRLRNTVVQLGDVRHADEVGHVAVGWANSTGPLDPLKMYD
ncbi:uncharacterized protein PV09_06073 [Verruconis gallopava]|uniref:Uncharacterized protein n=1 Tax=Verruconis gallopava TaxID=253628 RepID=A0A0D1YPT8_9PEZI|nr:uncharacterized protein PV09_06073 [Verruconis gallopava]KIW02632.1 hypothetical protein PV09_06073 [Verruconis gallopava]